MKQKVDITELEKRVDEIYERIMKLEEQTRHNSKTIKTLRQDLRRCQKELAKWAPVVKKTSAEELAVKKPPMAKPAEKHVVKRKPSMQQMFNDMPFEKRQQFIDSLKQVPNSLTKK